MKAIHFVGSLRVLTRNVGVVATGVQERGDGVLCRGSRRLGKGRDGQWTPAGYASCTVPSMTVWLLSWWGCDMQVLKSSCFLPLTPDERQGRGIDLVQPIGLIGLTLRRVFGSSHGLPQQTGSWTIGDDAASLLRVCSSGLLGHVRRLRAALCFAAVSIHCSLSASS
jgi:hypothetical protein